MHIHIHIDTHIWYIYKIQENISTIVPWYSPLIGENYQNKCLWRKRIPRETGLFLFLDLSYALVFCSKHAYDVYCELLIFTKFHIWISAKINATIVNCNDRSALSSILTMRMQCKESTMYKLLWNTGVTLKKNLCAFILVDIDAK